MVLWAIFAQILPDIYNSQAEIHQNGVHLVYDGVRFSGEITTSEKPLNTSFFIYHHTGIIVGIMMIVNTPF